MEVERFSDLSSAELTRSRGFACSCGRHHCMHVKYLRIGRGAVQGVAEAVRALGATRPMVVCAPDVIEAAGGIVDSLLTQAGVPHSLFIVPPDPLGRVEPAEEATGSVVLHLDRDCDLLIGVGSGVINDICRVVSTAAKIPMLIVGTAPSMDGYASASSSMVVGRVKQSLALNAPDGIILDTDIMADAPMKLLAAGLGDVLAKYTALCEWKLAALLRGEAYCSEVAALVKNALDQVVRNAPGLKRRDPDAVQSVAEGLVASGIGMAFMGSSRPASGLEHYFSHCWEMMALARGRAYELHGIQVGLGTLYTVMIMERMKDAPRPDMAGVEAAISAFDPAAWEANVRRVFGPAAGAVIALEEQLGKNAPEGRRARAQKIIEHWDDIVRIIGESIPSSAEILALMRDAGLPADPEGIGVSAQDAVDAFVCSRDIREKYLTSSMLWDIGYMEEFARWLSAAVAG